MEEERGGSQHEARQRRTGFEWRVGEDGRRTAYASNSVAYEEATGTPVSGAAVSGCGCPMLEPPPQSDRMQLICGCGCPSSVGRMQLPPQELPPRLGCGKRHWGAAVASAMRERSVDETKRPSAPQEGDTVLARHSTIIVTATARPLCGRKSMKRFEQERHPPTASP